MHSVKVVVAAIVLSGMLISGEGRSESDTAASSAGLEKAAVVDAGNKICPVMGEEVSGKDVYVYKGKSYGLCCPMCPATFASDPDKYSAIAEKEIAGKK